MAGIMSFEGLYEFVSENHPRVYAAIQEQVLGAVKFSDERDLLPEIFRLPVNMPWRKSFQLEERLREDGFEPCQMWVDPEGKKHPIGVTYATMGDLPSGIRLYLVVPPKQH